MEVDVRKEELSVELERCLTDLIPISALRKPQPEMSGEAGPLAGAALLHRGAGRPKVEDLIESRLHAKASRLASMRTEDGTRGGRPATDDAFQQI